MAEILRGSEDESACVVFIYQWVVASICKLYARQLFLFVFFLFIPDQKLF